MPLNFNLIQQANYAFAATKISPYANGEVAFSDQHVHRYRQLIFLLRQG